jgi:hypothetical protein
MTEFDHSIQRPTLLAAINVFASNQKAVAERPARPQVSGNFWRATAFKRGPVEIYGEMELLRLLDWFLDRAICFATEGYEHTASCRIDRALGALVARSWIGYRLCQSHFI